MVKEIQLANNRGVAIVDDCDFEELNKHKWHIDPGGYARRSEHLGMVNGKRKKRCILMHRQILDFPEGRGNTKIKTS